MQMSGRWEGKEGSTKQQTGGQEREDGWESFHVGAIEGMTWVNSQVSGLDNWMKDNTIHQHREEREGEWEFSLKKFWVSACGTLERSPGRQEHFQAKGEILLCILNVNWKHKEYETIQGSGVGWEQGRVSHKILDTH